MTFESHACIRRGHPLAVVGHGYRLPSSAYDLDLDLRSASIDGVLHELLDQIGWSGYDLPCGYLIGNGLGE